MKENELEKKKIWKETIMIIKEYCHERREFIKNVFSPDHF